MRHSGCRNISLKLYHTPDLIRLKYEDDGKGFEVAAVVGQPVTGSGVRNIMNRIKALKGNVEISSAPGKGMQAWITIPI